MIKNTHIHQQDKHPRLKDEHGAGAWDIIVVKTPRRVEGCPNIVHPGEPTIHANFRKLSIIESGLADHPESREVTEALDCRNNGVVSPGGDGTGVSSSSSRDELEPTSFVGDGW